MISVYTGVCGSGKSLDVAQIIMNRQRKKLETIGNLEVAKASPYYHYIDTMDLTPDYLVDFAKRNNMGKRVKEGKYLLIIDEAQLLFNSRTWSDKRRGSWTKFFQVHRHLGYDIILVCQHLDMIDKQIRSVCEYEVVHRNILLGGFGWLRPFCPYGLFLRYKKWLCCSSEQVLEKYTYRGTKKLCSFYDSYADFSE